MANQPLTNEEIKNFNKALEGKIEEAVKDNTKWKAVLPELMDSEIFVVAQISDKVDEKGNKMLNILSMQSKEGQQVIPFFTSPNRMAVLAGPERQSFNCMKMKTIKLFQAVKGKNTVLNPGHASCWKAFTPFEMNLLVMENQNK